MQHPAYEQFQPALRSTAAVFASPHSGRDYPWAFLRRSPLSEQVLRSSEDAFVDLLFADVPQYGAPLLTARTPRAFVDFNRGAEELDPALIRGVASTGHNTRVASGLGVIPRVVAGGRAIYRSKISPAEAQARLQEHWHPFHARLAGLMDEAMALFGLAVLIDCHSMPHDVLANTSPSRGPRPEVVLGDLFGASAAPWLVDQIEAAFVAAGLKVVRNSPFAGAYTAQRHGRPSAGRHVVQIEIDRALYMNEAEIAPNGNFAHMKALLGGVIETIAEAARPRLLPLAAE